MTTRLSRRSVLAGAALATGASALAAQPAAAAKPRELKVLAYNIWFGGSVVPGGLPGHLPRRGSSRALTRQCVRGGTLAWSGVPPPPLGGHSVTPFLSHGHPASRVGSPESGPTELETP